CARQDSNLDNW
nr:immunoglobulin heavy chain junction region [Macaca mulatta]